MPRRVANGVDINRLNMILAVLEKRCKLNMGAQDIYVNVIGGIRLNEPAVDLAVAMAIVSSYKNIVISPKTVFLGEVGLTGEIRSISSIEKRIRQIQKLGYDKIIGAKRQLNDAKKNFKDINITLVGFDTIDQIISYLLNNKQNMEY